MPTKKAPVAPTTVKKSAIKDGDVLKVKNAKGKEFSVSGRYYKANSYKLELV